ncbi:ATP-binding protein [Nonomuraea bangladeshensis]|uniref:ATP-binding protein n=1 Tax=Nonomuraea bangladeshensis TaxID=404385 RepID=UPI0031E21202
MPEATTAFIPAQRESHAVQPVLVEAMIGLMPGGLMWRRTFPGTEDQVPRARHFVRYLFADSSRRDDAEVAVAELATNAIRHTGSGRSRGTFIIELARTTVAVTVASTTAAGAAFPASDGAAGSMPYGAGGWPSSRRSPTTSAMRGTTRWVTGSGRH